MSLSGVTLDSSTDEASLELNSAPKHRKELSLDSGIQLEHCATEMPRSSEVPLRECYAENEVMEVIEDLDKSLEEAVGEFYVPSTPEERGRSSVSSTLTKPGHRGSVVSECFNLIEEVYVKGSKMVDSDSANSNGNGQTVNGFGLSRTSWKKSGGSKSKKNKKQPEKLKKTKAESSVLHNVSSVKFVCESQPDRSVLKDELHDSGADSGNASPRNTPVLPPSITQGKTDNTYVSFSPPSLDSLPDKALHMDNIQHVEVTYDNVTSSALRMTSISTGSADSGVDAQHHGQHFVVVAIDFGTTYSGYAFCFIRDPDSIHMMRKWEGGDPGINNQKTPTTLLLTPNEVFHSFGFSARDYFHDLEPQEAKRWLYFDKFKMALHHDKNLSRDSLLQASNGKSLPALTVFAHSLRYFKDHALRELSDQSGTRILNEDVRWVITVPAIWRQPAKQFMREAAYEAGIGSSENPDQLLIALEPEAASIYCRKLRLNQLVPERPGDGRTSICSMYGEDNLVGEMNQTVLSECEAGTRYIVVDCGGGTVDITVHELSDRNGSLRELHKATGGPYGSVGVDKEFEKLLEEIFSTEFLTQFKHKRPAAYVELMISFEGRKRSASPFKDNPLNIFPPFAFIDYYRKFKGKEVDYAVKKLTRKDISWSTQGMLRLQPEVMLELFTPTIKKIKQHIAEVLDSPAVSGVKYLFLVGGFAESQILQYEIRKEFSNKVKVIIPQGVSLTILRGAVLFGLDPGIINVRRTKYTYGVGVLKRFIKGVHPSDKRIEKDGTEWCADVFDKFVMADQSVGLGEVVVRSYTPTHSSQTSIVINIYSCDNEEAKFVTDPGVSRCGTLHLNLSEDNRHADVRASSKREIQTRMVFGDTEIKASALDVASGKCVRVDIDFLNQ